jgi:hypothetical protein
MLWTFQIHRRRYRSWPAFRFCNWKNTRRSTLLHRFLSVAEKMGNIINKSGADYSKNFPEIVEFSFRFFSYFFISVRRTCLKFLNDFEIPRMNYWSSSKFLFDLCSFCCFFLGNRYKAVPFRGIWLCYQRYSWSWLFAKENVSILIIRKSIKVSSCTKKAYRKRIFPFPYFWWIPHFLI